MEDFNIKDYLRDNGYENKVLDHVLKEVDLIFHIMKQYMDYISFKITIDEFQEYIANILTHSIVNKTLELEPTDDIDTTMDNVLNINKITDYYSDDLDKEQLIEVKSYYKRQLREFNKYLDFV